MGTCSIRFGSILTFDTDTEKDIIKVVEHLNATHSTGKFISNLIRVALDNPEILDKTTHPAEKGAVLKKIEEVNLSCNRHKFFNDITKNVDNMRKKVDKVYEMSLKTYTLAQMGKHLGLESKSNNTLLAGFILEKQLKDLQDTLGVSSSAFAFESNKLDEAHKRADATLEYIIETYDNLLNELKSQFEVKTLEIPVNQIVTTVKNTEETIESEVISEDDKAETGSATAGSDDEAIDFGEADFGALEYFFSNQDGV